MRPSMGQRAVRRLVPRSKGHRAVLTTTHAPAHKQGNGAVCVSMGEECHTEVVVVSKRGGGGGGGGGNLDTQ